MSGISSIGSSLLSNLLASQTSNQISDGASVPQAAGSSGITDIVSLLGESSPANDSLYGLLGATQGSDSTDSIYNLLLAGANAQLIKDNPTIATAILSAEQGQTQASDTGSSDSGQSTLGNQILQGLQNTNLLTINPESFVSLLEKYNESKNSGTTDGNSSGSQINQSV